MESLAKRLKKLLGNNPGLPVNLLGQSDVPYSTLVGYGREFNGIIFSAVFDVLADATGGSNTPLQIVTASVHNPWGFTLDQTGLHTTGGAQGNQYGISFQTATMPKGITFDADKLNAKIVSQIASVAAKAITGVTSFTGIDNTGTANRGFVVLFRGADETTNLPITAGDQFYIEIQLI